MKIHLDHLSPRNNYFSSKIGVFLMQKKKWFFIYLRLLLETVCSQSPLSAADWITVPISTGQGKELFMQS